MSYQALARKYRPREFSELVGQEHVARALVHALDQDRLHHAYLFTGTRGVGKTTVARILARSLNCEQGVSSRPCGACASCTEILEGRFVDLIEVDAASRTRVEDTRELLDNVQYAPTRGRYKVYLIDEVHMLSTHSFNALLKTLEEPPPHVKFLLATTDPKKLPVTVLSRCLEFTLKALSTERIAGHLRWLLEQEMIPADEEALRALARAARGSLRDALSLADQAIAYSGEKLEAGAVRAMLGTVDRDHVMRLLETLASGDPAAVLECLDGICEQAPEESALLDELITLLHRLAVAQAVPAREDDEAVQQLAGAFQAEQIQLFHDIGVRGRADLRDAPDARAALEMILLRMVLFRPDGVAAPGDETAKKPIEPAASVKSPAPAPEPVTTSVSPETGPAAAEPVAAVQSAPEPATGPAPAPETTPAPEARDPASWWAAVIDRLPLEGAVRSLATSCELLERDGDCWHMAMSAGHRVLAGEERVRALETALSEWLDRPVTLKISERDQVEATPDALARRRRETRRRELLEQLQGDPVVRELVSRFDARLDEASIQPSED